MNRHELFIDEYACWGCMACELACKQEHNPSEASPQTDEVLTA